MKRVLLVGASGVLGRAIQAELDRDHHVITAGRSSGELRVDLTDEASVATMFDAAGPVEAIVSAAGKVHFGALSNMTAAQFDIGLQDKLLGQVRLALLGQHHLNDGGSITLTTGILAEEPIHQGANATAVNAAVEGFVRAAACELQRPADQRRQPQRAGRVLGRLRPLLPRLRTGSGRTRRPGLPAQHRRRAQRPRLQDLVSP